MTTPGAGRETGSAAIITTLAGMPYPTARAAALAAREEPGLSAVRLDGMNLVMAAAAAEALEAEGVGFASLCWCPWAGRVMSVPVN